MIVAVRGIPVARTDKYDFPAVGHWGCPRHQVATCGHSHAWSAQETFCFCFLLLIAEEGPRAFEGTLALLPASGMVNQDSFRANSC